MSIATKHVVCIFVGASAGGGAVYFYRSACLGPADWSDSMSEQRMVHSLALDFIMPLMVTFKGNLVLGLPRRHPEVQ